MSETIGQQLKHAREDRYLTIAQVVAGTRIRAHYIEAMEADQFDVLPSPVQARGFLRLYTEFLGLKLDDMIARQRQAEENPPAAAPDLQEAASAPEPVPLAEEPPPPAPQPERKKPRRGRQAAPALSQPGATPDKEAPAAPTPEQSEPAPSADLPARPPAAAPSQTIFTDLGGQLRARRESLSLTLEEVERHTHVRKHYLQSLEAGEISRLPSPVQTRGMLSNYAHFLDMDVDVILLRFADALQAQLAERQVPSDSAPSQPPQRKPAFRLRLPAAVRRYLSADLLVGGGLILFLIAFAIWGMSRVFLLGTSRAPQQTAPSIINVLISPTVPGLTPTAASTGIASPTGAIDENTPATPSLAGSTRPVQIILAALESSWVRVSVDGKVKFEGRVVSGNAYPFEGDTQIEVLTGNGAAVSITYNQSNLGPMGTFGEVVDRIYTASAILNPTVTFTPSPTQTLKPSPTLRPTATPRFSPLPSKTPAP